MSLIVDIKSSQPEITEQDISRGFIYRYFAAKANQLKDKVYEINLREYSRLSSNPYVVTLRIRWEIRGKLEDELIAINTGTVLGDAGLENISVPGLLTSNRASVNFGSDVIPALKQKLTNFKEFYQDASTNS